MKIILDTNILLVSIPSKSQYRIIFNQLIQQKFNLIISNDSKLLPKNPTK